MILLALDIFVVGITIVSIILALYHKYSHFFKCINKIPGPPMFPLIGDTFLFLGTRQQIFANDRQRALQYYPIYKHWIVHVAAVCLYQPEDLEIVLGSMKHMRKSQIYDILHPWLGTGLLTSEGTKWKNRRKILTAGFHFSILQEFLNVFNAETAKLIKIIKERSDNNINLPPLASDFTLLTMAESSMGIKLDFNMPINQEYKKLIHNFGDEVTYRMVRPWLYNNTFYLNSWFGKKVRIIVKHLHQFSQKVIEERKKKFSDISYSKWKRPAMLDILLAAKENGSNINDEGIREEVDTFMFEGHDTTSVALCLSLMTIANQPRFQEEMYQEIMDVIGNSTDPPTYQQLQELNFVERCLKECLRLYPSVAFIAREVDEDFVTHSGYTVPKGAMIHIHIYDIHRNPKIWPEPEKFDPDRFLPENIKTRHPFAYLPFSAGPRNCIGQKFAMLELKAAFCGILRNFRLEPVDSHKDLIFFTDLVLRSMTPIRVKFIPRKN